MATTASITIEVDDAPALAGLSRVKAEAAAIGPALEPLQGVSTRTFDQVRQDTLRARESTMLLRDEFGIGIPRALRSTIAEASLIGPIMTAAFSGLAIMAFANIAVMVGEKIAGLVDRLAGWSAQAKVMNDLTAAANKSHLDSIEVLAKLQREYELIGLKGIPLFSKGVQFATLDMEAATKKAAILTDQLAALEKQARETETVTKMVPIGEGQTAETLVTQPTDAAKKAQGEIEGTRNQVDALKDRIAILNQGLADSKKKLDVAFGDDSASKLKAHEAEIIRIADATHGAALRLQEMATAADRAGLTGEAQITADALAKLHAVEEIFSKQPTLAAGAATAIDAIEAEASRKRLKIATDERQALQDDADAKLKTFADEEDQEVADAQAHAEKLRRMEDLTINIERGAAIASAEPWQRANASIVANYQDRMQRIQELIKTGDLDEQHAARMQTAAMTELFSQQRDLLATQMETLFNDITSGNIGKAFLAMFRRMVFEMVATWILGMQGMRAASGQAMGGGAGGILGTIFGGGGSSGSGGGILGGIFGGSGGSQAGISGIPGVITNFGPEGGAGGWITGLPTELSAGAMAMPALVGIGLSAGGGAGAIGTTLPTGGGVAGTAAAGAAGLGGILTKLFPNGLTIAGTTISGTMLATLGIGLLGASFGKGGVLGVLGSAAGGALTGFALGGPIGAIIGGIAGGIFGLVSSLFGQHKGDKARIQVMEPLIAQIKLLKDSYDVFQTPYNTGISQLETLRSTAITALHSIGGHQVSGNTASTNRLVDAAEAYMKTTEAERARRGQIAFGPPQFRTGGLVGPGSGGAVPAWFASSAMHFDSGGAVPAFLHENEFVMRPEAVSRIGAGNLARMNAGAGGGEVHNHYYINALDAKSVVELFRRMESEGSW
jgi:hypothetical protein